MIAYRVQQTRISIIAFSVGLYGLLGLTWGRRFMVHSFFPMILFVFAIPLSTVSETLTYPLRILVTKISWAIGHYVLAMPITRDGSQIIGPEGVYDVVAACSGIRSLTALGAVTMIYAFVGFADRGEAAGGAPGRLSPGRGGQCRPGHDRHYPRGRILAKSSPCEWNNTWAW